MRATARRQCCHFQAGKLWVCLGGSKGRNYTYSVMQIVLSFLVRLPFTSRIFRCIASIFASFFRQSSEKSTLFLIFTHFQNISLQTPFHFIHCKRKGSANVTEATISYPGLRSFAGIAIARSSARKSGGT